MNTNRKEIARFRNYGLFEDLGRELIKRGIVFEYIYTGGNIYLIEIGEPDGKRIWIDEDGHTVYYPETDQYGNDQGWLSLANGHGCLYEGEQCFCHPDQLKNLVTQIGIGVEIGVRQFKVSQIVNPARQIEYGLAVG